MNAILIDMQGNQNEMPHQNQFQNIMLPVLNNPLLAYHIDKLSQNGINKIKVISRNDYSAELADGNRWNVQLNYHKEINNNILNDWLPEDKVLLLPANTITILDIQAFMKAHQNGKKSLSQAYSNQMQRTPDLNYFNPIIINLKRLNDLLITNHCNSRDCLIYLMKEMADQSNKISMDFNQYVLVNYGGYWQMHQDLLKMKQDKNSVCPGFQMNDSVWVDLDSRMHPSVSADGFILVGKNSRIHKDVKLRGLTVIGNNVVIDSRTQIENSIIMDHTYIGSDMFVKGSVVRENYIYHKEKDLGVEIVDEILLRAI